MLTMRQAALARGSHARSGLVLSRPMARARQPKPSKTAMLSVRIDAALLADFDEEAHNYAPGVSLSRPQAVQAALREWIAGRQKLRQQ